MNEVLGCFHPGSMAPKRARAANFTPTASTKRLHRRSGSILFGTTDPTDKLQTHIEKLNSRNAFIAGRMNAAFEKPISAVHSKFDGKVPDGKFIDKVEQDTLRLIQRYVAA